MFLYHYTYGKSKKARVNQPELRQESALKSVKRVAAGTGVKKRTKTKSKTISPVRLKKVRKTFLSVNQPARVEEKKIPEQTSISRELQEISWDPFFKWGNTYAQKTFFYPEMVQAKLEGQQVVIKNHIYINHADVECYKMDGKPCRDLHLSFLNIPKLSQENIPFNNNAGSRGRGKKNRNLDNKQSILYDNEVILGGISKLKNILDNLEQNAQGLTCIINCSCTPKMIGADIDSLVKKLNSGGKNKYIYYSENLGSPGDIYIEHMQKCLQQAENDSLQEKRDSVNIVGLTKDNFYLELSELLTLNGIELNTSVIPVFHEDLVRNYYQSRLQVIIENEKMNKMYEEVFKKLAISTLILTAPYGFKNSEKFLSAIVKELNPQVEIKFNENYQALKKKWLSLTAEARCYSLGLIVNEIDIERLIEPSKFTRSIPLLEVLEEMQFKLKILIYCSPRRREEFVSKITSKLKDPEKHKLIFYSTDEDISEVITEADCIYSDLRFDERIINQGKLTFSISLLEQGFAGAVKSLEKLVKRCRLKYIRNYKKYFGLKPEPINKEIK